MKIIVGLCTIVLSTLIGANFSKTGKKRLTFFSALRDLNSDLLINLLYKRESAAKIICDGKYDDEIKRAYESASRSGENGFSENTLDFLDEDSKTYVFEYFRNIGKRDLKGEEEFLSYNAKKIQARLNDVESERKKNKNLGEKLGFMLGLTVFILII